MAAVSNILVIDDEESMREACVQTLREEGYRARAVGDGRSGLELAGKESFDVVVLDLKMPGIPGMEVLKRIKRNNPGTMVIIITAYGAIDVAVEAMRHGAFDFLTKPFTPETLRSVVEKAVDSRRRSLESMFIPSSPDGGESGAEMIIGRSPAMIRVARLIKKVAPSDSTVLIQGETGVGKELVARTLHRLSRRSEKPFVTVDCGALVETLFESELFGHVKGSFTGATETTRGKFELARGGTIFLDEISNITINMQARLLRVIQEREIAKIGSAERIRIDVRITAATNKNLTEEIEKGNFREDLFYRLNVVPIRLPPLRERREDIPLLAEHFLKTFVDKGRGAGPKFSDEAIRFLEGHEWPGNVRELRNAVERAVVTCEGAAIGPKDLSFGSVASPGGNGHHEMGALAEREKDEIEKALDLFEGHKTRAAEYLGINRKTLREKIRKYGIKA